MEQTETSATDSTERIERTSELVRPLEGRMVAGVAKGIANHFGISEWIPRLVFFVTAFMGGLGIALYAAGWAFLRSEDEPTTPAEKFFSGASGSSSWVGLALIVVAGIIVLSNFTILAGEVIWAGILLVVGLLLYLGYLPGLPQGSKTTDNGPESKEGVQPMTGTDTITRESELTASGDSPAGGDTSPPTPTPPPPARPPAPPRERSYLGRLTIGVIAIGLGVLALLDNLGVVAADIEPYHYLALAVTILGVGLLVGAFVGRARWLILIGVFMVPTLIFSPYFGYDFDSRTFELESRPISFLELEEEYHVNLGNLEIDLSDLPWNGEEVQIDASVDMGNLEITIPDGVGIVGSAGVNVGLVSEPGRSSGGLGDPNLDWDQPGRRGTVILDAHVNVGNIEIRR